MTTSYKENIAQEVNSTSTEQEYIAMLKNGGKHVKEKYGISTRNQPGIVIIFGYPAVKYRRAIRRNLAKIHYY